MESQHEVTENFCENEDDKLSGTNDNEDITFQNAIPQIFASVSALSVWFYMGLGGGFSAVLLPQLAANDSSIPITESQASWIAGLMPLSTCIGSVIVAYLVDLLGRRDATKVQIIPIVISWATMAWAEDVTAIYVSRIITGITAGMGHTSSMYVAEISHPAMRGALSNMALLWASFGTLVAYTLGALLSWRVAALVCAVIPLFTLVSLCFVPESPRWLLAMRRKEDAEKALNWFYRKNTRIAAFQWNTLKLEDTSNLPKLPLIQRLRLMIRPGVLKPLGILFGFFIFQQLSGVYVLLFYTVDIFQRVGSGLNPFLATIFVGIVRVTTSGVAVVASRRLGRRTLAIWSGLGMMVTMVTAGTCLFIAEDNPAIGWVSLVCVLFYMFASAMGFLCLPWSMPSELLPLDVRGVGSGICNTVNHLLMFAMLKAYPPLADALQGFGIMWFFATTSFGGVIYLYFLLPETFGKTLLEIEANFNRKSTSK